MKIEAETPFSVELVALNDWRYYSGLGFWQIGLLHVETGWPPLVVVKILGLGFRLEVTW